MTLIYYDENGEIVHGTTESDLPAQLFVPLQCINHMNTLLQDDSPDIELNETLWNDEQVQLKQQYINTWFRYQTEMPATLPDAFNHLVTEAPDREYQKIVEMEREFGIQLKELYQQYNEALSDLMSAHRLILSTVTEDEAKMLKKQQKVEVFDTHDRFIGKLNTLNKQQKDEFSNAVVKIYLKNVHGKKDIEEQLLTKKATHSIEPVVTENKISEKAIIKAEKSPSESQGTSVQIKDLMDMGFTKEDAAAALDLAKQSMVSSLLIQEQAVILLLESPDKVEEFKKSKSKVLIKSKSSLLKERKSSSLANISEPASDAVLREVKPIDWSRRRSFSDPKLAAQVKNKEPSKLKNPFVKVGNFLEKAIDALMLDEES
jgi:predicted transcriptional regulator